MEEAKDTFVLPNKKLKSCKKLKEKNAKREKKTREKDQEAHAVMRRDAEIEAVIVERRRTRRTRRTRKRRRIDVRDSKID